MSLAGSQIIPINLNFHLQKCLENFDKNSADKIQSKNYKGDKSALPHANYGQTTTSRYTFMFLLCIWNGCFYCVSLRKCVRLNLVHFLHHLKKRLKSLFAKIVLYFNHLSFYQWRKQWVVVFQWHKGSKVKIGIFRFELFSVHLPLC